MPTKKRIDYAGYCPDVNETISDGDFVHVHYPSKYLFAWVLIADEPETLVGTRNGPDSVPAKWVTRAVMTFQGPVCLDCQRLGIDK